MPRGGKRKGAGMKPGTKHKRTLEWESFGRILLSEGVAKARTELMKLKGEKFLYHFEKFVSYFQVKKPVSFDLTVSSPDVRDLLKMSDRELDDFIKRFEKSEQQSPIDDGKDD